jgi:putative transcriptional regulator
VNNRLRELRAARRWSQADLADRLDVSRQTINAVETGRYDPSLPLAFKLAALFELPIESVFLPGSAADGHPDKQAAADCEPTRAENQPAVPSAPHHRR